jgi:PEGA domain
MPLRYLLPTLCLIVCFSQTGCVHRRLTVNSNPPGALVRVDGKDIGYTPASIDFTWYGTREVQLLKDGYETQTQMVDINPPWYQRFPLDFFSDNFLGKHITDRRQVSFQMQPRRMDVSSDVVDRGRSLRSESLHGR